MLETILMRTFRGSQTGNRLSQIDVRILERKETERKMEQSTTSIRLVPGSNLDREADRPSPDLV
jgi:hypothetical protein